MTNDPDLDQALVDLRYDARRVRDLQRSLPHLDDTKDYRKLASVIADLADLEDRFAARGERLKLATERRRAGRALMRLTEEADRLQTKLRRRPNALQLVIAMQEAAAVSERTRAERETEEIRANYAKRLAAHDAAAEAAAVEYLEASR